MLDRIEIDKATRIGILGGGQLGKMLAQEAKRMSYNVMILDPTPDCPAAAVSDRQIVASFDDPAAIRQLSEECDVMTFEIELVNSDILMQLEREGRTIHPSGETLKIIQDKLMQKQMLRASGIPVPDFEEVSSEESLLHALAKLGYPAVLKARRGSYDGRGNFLIGSRNDVPQAMTFLNGRDGFLERFVHFTKEVSLMVARNSSGQIAAFPLAENVHRNHVLDMTIVPARVPDIVKQRAKKIAIRTMQALKGAGIFGIEMFVTKKNEVLINEIAPRPHNSGHYTIEACNVSQFEQHIRAILDMPIHEPRLLSPAVMVNILGDDGLEGPYAISGIRKAMSIPGVKLHIYGKKTTKRGRKIGHITVTDRTVAGAMEKVKRTRAAIKILQASVVRIG